MGAKYTDYIGIEVKQALEKCIEKPQFEHHYFKTPEYNIIEKVGKVNYGESNYATGPMTKTIFVEDAFGSHYKVSIEDLKHIKGHGWITHKEANKIDHHYDRDLGTYIVDTPKYTKWLAESNAKWASKRKAS
jgi:hypothetical protein